MVSHDISIYIDINHIYVLYMKYNIYIYIFNSYSMLLSSAKKDFKDNYFEQRDSVIVKSFFCSLENLLSSGHMMIRVLVSKGRFSLSCLCLCFVMESAVLVSVLFYGMIILLYMQICASLTCHHRNFFFQ